MFLEAENTTTPSLNLLLIFRLLYSYKIFFTRARKQAYNFYHEYPCKSLLKEIVYFIIEAAVNADHFYLDMIETSWLHTNSLKHSLFKT